MVFVFGAEVPDVETKVKGDTVEDDREALGTVGSGVGSPGTGVGLESGIRVGCRPLD